MGSDSPSGRPQAPFSGKEPFLDPLPEGALGIPASSTHPPLQTDSYKELVNKVAWVLGSTYRVNYSNKRSIARVQAQRLVVAILKVNGYPRQIGV